MKPYYVWIFVGIMLSEMFGFSSMSLAAKEEWTKKADMPTPRTGLSTSVVNGKIYALGGKVEGGKPSLSAIEEYEPIADIWRKRANMPTPREWFSASVVNGKIYVIGGHSPEIVPMIVEEYDPATDTWTKKARMRFPRVAFSASVVNGKIYVIGGNAAGLPSVEEYDPATDKWTTKADMPTRRYNLSTSVVNGKIYAIGGNAPAGNEIRVLSTVEEYDPTTDTWTKKTDMPTARYVLSTSVVNGIIYAIGGHGEPRDGLPQPLSRVEAFDPVANKWTKKADMPTARWGLSTSTVNGKIYAIGGSKGALGFSTVEEFDTGFVAGQGIDAKGKFVTLWGKLKAED